MPTFEEMVSYTGRANYEVDVSWTQLQWFLEKYCLSEGLQMNPDFQRGHVWTEAQQVAFVEHKMRGGAGGKHVYFNHPGWFGSFKGDFVLVDGLQRLTAVMRFLKGEIKAFGYFFNEFEGGVNPIGPCSFKFVVNTLETKAEVLKWYLEINEGGTPHTKEELDKVRSMLQVS